MNGMRDVLYKVRNKRLSRTFSVSDHRLRCRNPNAHPYYGVYAEILLTASNFRGWRSTITPVKGWIPSGYALHQINALTAALRGKTKKMFISSSEMQ